MRIKTGFYQKIFAASGLKVSRTGMKRAVISAVAGDQSRKAVN